MVLRGWAASSLLACAVLTATACTRPVAQDTANEGVSVNNAPATPTSSASQQVQCDPGKEPWRSQSTPVRGGIMRRAAPAFDFLDPTVPGASAVMSGALVQVYNGLLELRGCFYGDTEMAPSLAKAWEVSSDGRIYTFHLRDSVKWQNLPPVAGRAFTSADVAWTIDYQQKGGLLRSYWSPVTHQEPDSQTVVMHLPEPDADFIGKVGYWTNMMVPHEIQEQYGDFKTVAVGTGAYRLKDFKLRLELNEVPNPDYYDTGVDGKPLPYMDGLQTEVFADYAAHLAAFRSGQLDTVLFQGLDKLDSDDLIKSQPKNRYYDEANPSNATLYFNLSKAPWNDVRVRKAFQLALNRQDLIDGVYRGGAEPAGFLPAAFKTYLWPVDELNQRFAQNLDQARGMLAEAGYQPGSINANIVTASPYAQGAEVAQEALKQIGVTSTIDTIGDAFTPIVATPGNLKDLAWGNLAGNYFVGYWMGDLVRSGSSLNYLGLSDPQLDQLATAQKSALEPAKRKQVLDQEQQRMYDLMPWVPTVSNQYHRAESCRLRNHARVSPAYNPRGDVQAWLDPAGC